MIIRKYTPEDEKALFQLLATEGDEWIEYLTAEGAEKFKKTLETSLTFVAYEGDHLCGFSRSFVDGEFFVCVCDLLVEKQFRGKSIGRRLMECIYDFYPDHQVIVLSDVDIYYEKLGYEKIGSVFTVKK